MKATFVEVRGFSEVREDYLPDPAYARFQRELMANPDAGDVMPGCGGLRKIRFGDRGRGKGKRGGVRVIYLHVPEAKRFYLIDVYGKDKQDDIAAADKKILGRLAMEIEAAAIAQYKEWEEETNHDEAS